MDLIRKVLADLEAEAPSGYQGFDFNQYRGEYDLRLVAYHLELMAQADLITIQDHRALHGEHDVYWGVRISWQGHEFLDAVRSPKVWNEVKEKVGSTVGSVSYQVLGELARQVARSLVGL